MRVVPHERVATVQGLGSLREVESSGCDRRPATRFIAAAQNVTDHERRSGGNQHWCIVLLVVVIVVVMSW